MAPLWSGGIIMLDLEAKYKLQQEKEQALKHLLMAESYLCSVSQPDEDEGDRPCWNWPKDEKFNSKLSDANRLQLAIDLIQKAIPFYVKNLP